MISQLIEMLSKYRSYALRFLNTPHKNERNENPEMRYLYIVKDMWYSAGWYI